jgi:hypothetical protein
VQGPRQEKRWPEIQANGRLSVKNAPTDPLAGICAQVAFPILAVAPSPRHTGIVCLDGRLRAIVARSCRGRDCDSDESIADAVLRRFERELRLRAPGIVVVEHGVEPSRAQLSDVVAERVVEHARNAGVRTRELSLPDACKRITGGESSRDTAIVLLGRYEALRKRLAPLGTPVFRHERWREAKPLMTAFALAHAVALEVLTTAIRPLGAGPPEHDHGNSFW